MPRIFISYRRSDSADITARIYDDLVRAFGEKNVFKDVNKIPVGKDFRAVIESELISSDVMLVIIGPGWLDTKDANGNRRLDDPTDFVRIEVEMGLRHAELIPVLVKGGSMPGASLLPSNLNPLAYKNARQIRDSDYNDDMKKLVTDLHAIRGKGILGHIAWGKVSAVIVTVLTIILAFLALLSEEWRNDFFYKLGVYTATSLALVQNPTDTPQSPTETATNTSVPPTNTEIPQPVTETPTITTLPSDTPQPSIPTNTPAPPTNTSIPASPTTPTVSGPTITLTIFRDEDSLTLYMPDVGDSLSLAELIFQVEIGGQNRPFPLMGYSSFGGDSILGDVKVLNSAACFRLIRNGSQNPAPLECQSGVMPLTQNVADADVFWYDSTANQHRTVLVLRDRNTVAVCAAGQTTCVVEWPLAGNTQNLNMSTSTTDTVPSALGCKAVITAFGVTQVRVYENERITSSRLYTVPVGSEVIVLAVSDDNDWYKIQLSSGSNMPGWIESSNFTDSDRANLNACLQ